MSSYIVWRDENIGNNQIARKLRVTNLVIPGDVVATQQEIDAWYENSDRETRIHEINEQLDALNREGMGYLLDGNQTELDRVKAARIVLQSELQDAIAHVNIYNQNIEIVDTK